MEWLETIISLLEQGSNLEGGVGLFFNNITPSFVGTLIFITLLYTIRKIPVVKAIHQYAVAESDVDREQSEFLKMFTDPKTRIKLNIAILIGLIVLLLLCSLILFGTVSVPFIIFNYPNSEVSVFSASMICLLLFALISWAMWLLNRFKEQVAKAIRLDKELVE